MTTFLIHHDVHLLTQNRAGVWFPDTDMKNQQYLINQELDAQPQSVRISVVESDYQHFWNDLVYCV